MGPESQQMIAQMIRLLMATPEAPRGIYTGPKQMPMLPTDFFSPVTPEDIKKWTK